MVLAIVRKDLRETWLFAVLALGIYLAYLVKLTGIGGRALKALLDTLFFVFDFVAEFTGDASDVPFVDGGFLAVYFLIGVVLAIALGFRQSAWEPSQGTALYLLHLPLTRRTIFVTKLMTGAGLLLACTLVPILIYATWAWLPRTHPGPFEWSMTFPAFQLWLIMPLAYLGAFASGIRPARWIGSRLLPLVAVLVPGVSVEILPHWWLIGFPILLFVAAALVSDILWEAETRDF
jgi:hypothetical protein